MDCQHRIDGDGPGQQEQPAEAGDARPHHSADGVWESIVNTITPASALTGIDGKANFNVSVQIPAGTFVVDAYVDVNDNGVQDPTDPTAAATLTMTVSKGRKGNDGENRCRIGAAGTPRAPIRGDSRPAPSVVCPEAGRIRFS